MTDVQEIETYEYICMVNRYLFQQMEDCTMMIHMLEGHNLDVSEWKAKRARLKTASNVNLDKLEIMLITMDL